MSDSQNCAGCKEHLPENEYLQCVTCKAKYDIECANISSQVFNSMERKDKWGCPECISKNPKKGNTNTPVRNCQTETAGLHESKNDHQNITHRPKTARLRSQCPQGSSVKYNDSNNSHSGIVDELKIFMTELIHNQMGSIKEALDTLNHTIKAQNIRIEQLENRVTLLESQTKEVSNSDAAPLENVITQLQADIAERDQELLCNDLEIAGCTESSNENCVHIVISIAKKIGVELDIKDVVNAERAGPKRQAAEAGAPPPSARPLVVRLARRALRDAVIQAARTRRSLSSDGLHLPGPIRLLYVNERLTKHNRHIFHKARALAREMRFKYIWTRDGKIFARRDEGTPRHRLRNETDLLRVFGKSNV